MLVIVRDQMPTGIAPTGKLAYFVAGVEDELPGLRYRRRMCASSIAPLRLATKRERRWQRPPVVFSMSALTKAASAGPRDDEVDGWFNAYYSRPLAGGAPKTWRDVGAERLVKWPVALSSSDMT